MKKVLTATMIFMIIAAFTATDVFAAKLIRLKWGAVSPRVGSFAYVATMARLVNKDLGEMLNMSRTPIINALNRLVQDGIVGFESFRGFYVKPIDIEEVWDAFGVREALEVYAVEQAIKRGDADDMAILGFLIPETGIYEISLDDFGTIQAVDRIR